MKKDRIELPLEQMPPALTDRNEPILMMTQDQDPDIFNNNNRNFYYSINGSF